jgi:hypothetical protein
MINPVSNKVASRPVMAEIGPEIKLLTAFDFVFTKPGELGTFGDTNLSHTYYVSHNTSIRR